MLQEIDPGIGRMKRWGGVAALVAAVLLVQMGAALAEDAKAEAKPKQSIKDVMKAAYKGDDSLRAKIIAGTATPEQRADFLKQTDALVGHKAPKGAQAAWEAKVAALVKASHDLLGADAAAAAGAPAGAADEAKLTTFKSASDCRACHTAHRGR